MWEYSVEDLECLYRNSSPEDHEELLQEILTAATRGEAEVRWVLDNAHSTAPTISNRVLNLRASITVASTSGIFGWRGPCRVRSSC